MQGNVLQSRRVPGKLPIHLLPSALSLTVRIATTFDSVLLYSRPLLQMCLLVLLFAYIATYIAVECIRCGMLCCAVACFGTINCAVVVLARMPMPVCCRSRLSHGDCCMTGMVVALSSPAQLCWKGLGLRRRHAWCCTH